MNAEVAVHSTPRPVTKLEARRALNKITVEHRKQKIGDTRFEFEERLDDGTLVYIEIDNGIKRGKVVVGRRMGIVRIVTGFVFTPEDLRIYNPQLKTPKKKSKKKGKKSGSKTRKSSKRKTIRV